MGVLSCNRNNCDKIMCDRHSSDHGYLCYECFDELCGLGINADVDTFMSSKKGHNGNSEDARTWFSEIFRDQDEDQAW